MANKKNYTYVIQTAPQLTIRLTNQVGWVVYQNGYIEFARFDEDGASGERLSHWVDWGRECYPRNKKEIKVVLSRVLASFL